MSNPGIEHDTIAKVPEADQRITIEDYKLAGELYGYLYQRIGDGDLLMSNRSFCHREGSQGRQIDFTWHLGINGKPYGFQFVIDVHDLRFGKVTAERLAFEIAYRWQTEAYRLQTQAQGEESPRRDTVRVPEGQ